MFIDEQKTADHADHGDEAGYVYNAYDNRIELLSSACDDEFNTGEIKLLYGLILDSEPHLSTDEIALHDYLQRRYQYLNQQASKQKIPKRFGYLKSIIGKEIR